MIKLPPSETITIEKNVSKNDVIPTMQRLTVGFYKISIFNTRKPQEPRFVGKVCETGYKALMRDTDSYKNPIFIPPYIDMDFIENAPF